jgi:hypothetical protein
MKRYKEINSDSTHINGVMRERYSQEIISSKQKPKIALKLMRLINCYDAQCLRKVKWMKS